MAAKKTTKAKPKTKSVKRGAPLLAKKTIGKKPAKKATKRKPAAKKPAAAE